ncbi:hypothetical protein MVEN_01680900 [Mycena venus]|uniref:Uncharacterized protein n=1 Tax=Mycena venus TaxID=2733690 RepID=A0A8H6XMT4_9AGAR|nr:hypothetical protein MVEN_01680900 [Mycena venus]
MSFSKDNSNYAETAHLTEPEEEFDPYRLQEKPIPPRQFRLAKRGLWFHLMGWPVLVVLAQLFLQALGWGFLAAIKYQGQIALPFSTAQWAESNPHIVTLVATLVSTVLAACSSYFFSYALRRSMSLYLLRPMSLAALGASVNIAMRSLVFHRRHWKWPAVSLLFFIMAGIQTSVWSTLITPVRVVISTPLVGHEIDLESPILQQMYSAGTFDVCQRAGRDGAVYGGVPESGYANGEAYLGLPAAVSLLSRGFNVSTRGILAATLNDTHVGSWSIPGTVQMQGSRPRGISDTYSMSQQGFTADVSCAVQTLTNDTTSPTVSWYVDSVKQWGTDLPRPNITYINVSSNCTAKPPVLMNLTDAYVSADGEYLWAVGCDPTPEAPNNYTLILQATGNYTDLTGRSETSYLVCQIAPKATMVRADYAGEINVSLMESSESAGPPTIAAGGAAGFYAMYFITDLVWHQQGITVNGVADQLVELSESVADDERFKIVEKYLQGVIEFGASILRACLSADDLTFVGGVPSNITRPISGTWATQTLGWKRFSIATTLWILIPGIFMFCSTLALVVVAVYRHRSEIYSDHTQIFDPSNPLHLIAAAAAGGLNNVFRGFGERDINDGAKLPVLLGSVPGRGPALVRADEYAPVSADTFALQSLEK